MRGTKTNSGGMRHERRARGGLQDNTDGRWWRWWWCAECFRKRSGDKFHAGWQETNYHPDLWDYRATHLGCSCGMLRQKQETMCKKCASARRRSSQVMKTSSHTMWLETLRYLTFCHFLVLPPCSFFIKAYILQHEGKQRSVVLSGNGPARSRQVMNKKPTEQAHTKPPIILTSCTAAHWR